MRNIYKHIIPVFFCVSILLLTSCGAEEWTDGEFKQFDKTVYVEVENAVRGEGEYHTNRQLAYIQSTYDTIPHFGGGYEEYSRPQGVPLEMSDPTNQYVKLSMKADMSDSRVITFAADDDKVVHNLLSNTKYYYTDASDENFTTPSEIKSFTVANTLPRNLYIEGVTNVRDLGGYTTKDGKTIKQNMFIRGGRMNIGRGATMSKPIPTISEKSLYELTHVIGVKSEIDLREAYDENNKPENGNMNNDVFKDINYNSIPIDTGKYDNLMDNHEEVKKVFQLLAKPETYPVYLHCTIGTDRTGMISYLLGALLGMENNDLARDYLFSNLGNIGSSRNVGVLKENYYPKLKSYKKATLARCAEAFLKDIGIKQREIDSIKNILLVD